MKLRINDRIFSSMKRNNQDAYPFTHRLSYNSIFLSPHSTHLLPYFAFPIIRTASNPQLWPFSEQHLQSMGKRIICGGLGRDRTGLFFKDQGQLSRLWAEENSVARNQFPNKENLPMMKGENVKQPPHFIPALQCLLFPCCLKALGVEE